jgi:CRISPR/Cas system-associated endoribonuclease Cas2
MLRFGNFANEGAWLQNLNFPCRIRPSGIWQCAQLSKGWNRFIQDAMQALLFSVMIYSYFFTM